MREELVTTVAEHYDIHLGPVYQSMVGGIELALSALELDALPIPCVTATAGMVRIVAIKPWRLCPPPLVYAKNASQRRSQPQARQSAQQSPD
jgi:hypothetical protein